MKARLPKGVGGGPGNMQSMIKQAQKMQEQMTQLQTELDEREYTAAAGGGAVSCTVSGKREVLRLDIKPEVVDPEDVEMLQDMVLSAANEALRQAEDAMNKAVDGASGGLNLGAFGL